MPSEPKKKRFTARPLLIAGAGLAVISMGATQAFASGNLMAHRPCNNGTAWNGKDCVKPDAPDAGAPDAGLRKLTRDEGSKAKGE